MKGCHTRALVLATIALAACADVRDELPEKIGVEKVLASTSSGVFMSACASTIFRLSHATAQGLDRKGLALLRGMDPPPNQDPGNPYADWSRTPLAESEANRIFALSAISGCDNKGTEYHAAEIEAALESPGSYYTLTKNREGMIVVAPRVTLAAFLYFG